MQERSAEVSRLHKTLEGANIKLASVATDIMGNSGRQMLRALIAGSTDTSEMAQLAVGVSCGRRSRNWSGLSAGMLRSAPALSHCPEQLAHIDFLEETIEQLSAQIAQRMRPLEEALERLETIGGVGRRTAEAILVEMGADMSRLPTYRQLAS